MDKVVSEDVLLHLLDRDYITVLSQLRESRDLRGLAIASSYGVLLPQGREWGLRPQREAWLLSERAKHVRRLAAEIVIEVCLTEDDLMTFYRLRRDYAGYGRLMKSIIRDWHNANKNKKTN